MLLAVIWAFDQIQPTEHLPILSQFPNGDILPWMVMA
jgi:hypothetical protein